MPIPKEHLEFLKSWNFISCPEETSSDGATVSFRNPDWAVHGVVKMYFKTQGYANRDIDRSGHGRVYMRHTGNPHVNLERAPQDYTVQISWGRRKGCGVSFLRPLPEVIEKTSNKVVAKV